MIGGALLHDPAIAHQSDFIGHAHRLGGFMGDQQDSGPLGLEHIQRLVPDIITQPVIKPRKRLVHQHDLGARGKGAGQSDALLFAARQFMRIGVDMADHADAGQQFGNTGLHAGTTFQAKAHVLRHAQMRKQGKILKHQANPPALGRGMGDGIADHLTIDTDLPAVLGIHPRNDPQGGRFAAARRAQQTGHLPRHDLQRHIIDDAPPTETAGQVANLQPGCRAGHSNRGRSGGGDHCGLCPVPGGQLAQSDRKDRV